jgi:hypothetical protein
VPVFVGVLRGDDASSLTAIGVQPVTQLVGTGVDGFHGIIAVGIVGDVAAGRAAGLVGHSRVPVAIPVVIQVIGDEHAIVRGAIAVVVQPIADFGRGRNLSHADSPHAAIAGLRALVALPHVGPAGLSL